MRVWIGILGCLWLSAAGASERLVVYSERKPPLIEPLFAAYTAATGVRIETVSDNATVLLQRIKAEGRRSPADLYLTVDAGDLVQAAAAGVLAVLDSPALTAAVPEHLRDPGGRWFGLSMRVRTMVYNPDRVRPEEFSSYAALADARWRGKLCLRSSKKVYNQSLVATQIAHRGVDAVEAMVRGWVANLAVPPFADDTLAIRAVAAGQCEVALVNSYYLGRLQAEDPNIKARLYWADQDGPGVHVNISGAGVVASSTRRESAQRLLEWLAGAEAQAKFAQANYEYPVRAGVELDPIVAAWGPFQADRINVGEAGRLQADAVKLMDRSGWR